MAHAVERDPEGSRVRYVLKRRYATHLMRSHLHWISLSAPISSAHEGQQQVATVATSASTFR